MNRAVKFLFFACSVLLGGSAVAEGNPRLAEIEHEVAEKSAELEQISTRRVELEVRLKKYNELLKLLADQERTLREVLDQTDRAKRAAETALKDSKQQLDSLQTASTHRLRAVYMISRGQELSPLTLFKTGTDVGRSSWYLTKLKSYDRTLMDRYSSAMTEQQARKVQLEEVSGKQQDLKGRITSKKDELAAERAEQKRLISEIAQEQRLTNEAIAALRAEAARLENVVSSMTGAKSVEPEEAKFSLVPPDQNPFEAEGLGLRPGLKYLVLPIRGKVTRKFGKSSHKAFQDFVFSRGIEFTTKPDAEVIAIADGRVLFLGRMPAYGTLVIIDHGKRHYSLYGRLLDPAIEQGKSVRKGERIGLPEPQAGGDALLYFEIRREGKPVNPTTFFPGVL